MAKKAKAPRVHRHTLIEMNLAPFTARRDAAHERVMEVLHKEMIRSKKEERITLYQFCLDLLDEAILATRRSQTDQDTPLMHYLQLLRDTISACFALVRHELMVVHEAEQFSRDLGPEIVAELQTADDVFSASEENIHACIDDLLKFGKPICARDTHARKRRFTPDDHQRYEETLEAYREHYRRIPSEPAGAAANGDGR
ncbi:MAG: hypothetical protein GXP31_18970 [Kiritimatiellaeota bacterium]|nr:hypothetical protein [Kiritimatiellota bacterium]